MFSSFWKSPEGPKKNRFICSFLYIQVCSFAWNAGGKLIYSNYLSSEVVEKADIIKIQFLENKNNFLIVLSVEMKKTVSRKSEIFNILITPSETPH